MPVIEVHLLKGYDDAAKQRLAEALTDASRLVVPAPPEAITVMIHEMHASSYYRGRTTRIPAPAAPDPCLLVRRFLDCLGNRDLDTARQSLAQEFQMHFPGAQPMHDLQELVDWSVTRYRSIAKTYDGFEAMHGSGDASIVYCRGTLSGQWLNESAFSGIRFIDRFEIIDGKISRQDVWNDLGEHQHGRQGEPV